MIRAIFRRALLCALLALMISGTAFAELEARFIDVGQGDACIITCDGETMIVDGGEPSQSSKMVAILRNLGIDTINHMVNTHPHSDHLGGLNGPLNTTTVLNVYSCVTEYDTDTFAAYSRFTTAQGTDVRTLGAGDSFALGGATVYVLAPVDADTVMSVNMNDNSIVLRIVYGANSLLLTGDAEAAEEQTMLDSGATLKSDVLKVGHHGSATSTSQAFFDAVSPQYAIISVGAANKYGHPAQDTLDKLAAAGAQIFRTDQSGDIIVQSDGQNITIRTDAAHSAAASPTVPPDGIEYYIGNLRSLKFHTPYCSSLPAEHNRIIFMTRDEAVEAGYSPCGSCKP